MARPMLLVGENLLTELHDKWKLGVPVCKLIQQYRINITHPTLAKLIRYYDLSVQNTTNTDTILLIRASLFPDWLDMPEYSAAVVKQPPSYRYEGTMPIGKWVLNNWTEV